MIHKFLFRNKLFTFAFFIFLASILLLSCQKEKSSRTEVALGTVCTVSIFEKTSPSIYDRIFEKINQIEKLMSASLPNSEISKINQNAGIKPVKISSDTFTVLSCAKEIAILSDGAFEPTIGRLVKLWNINSIVNDTTGKILPKLPSQSEIEKALAKTDYKKLILDKENQTAFLQTSGMELDVGGIAKGFAADEMTKILAENKITYGIINLGGNIFAYGSKDVQKKGEQWNIGIKNPLEPEKGSGFSVYVKNKTVVTSGNYERYFETNGTRYHHIIDVKNGYPSQNGVVSFTIVADSSMIADALSTSCFILGKEKGIQLLESLGIDGFCITKDRKLYATKGLKDNINILDDSFSFAS